MSPILVNTKSQYNKIKKLDVGRRQKNNITKIIKKNQTNLIAKAGRCLKWVVFGNNKKGKL